MNNSQVNIIGAFSHFEEEIFCHQNFEDMMCKHISDYEKEPFLTIKEIKVKLTSIINKVFPKAKAPTFYSCYDENIKLSKEVAAQVLGTVVLRATATVKNPKDLELHFLPVFNQLILEFDGVFDKKTFNMDETNKFITDSFKRTAHSLILCTVPGKNIDEKLRKKINISSRRIANNYEGQFKSLPSVILKPFLISYGSVKAIEYIKRIKREGAFNDNDRSG